MMQSPQALPGFPSVVALRPGKLDVLYQEPGIE